MHRAKFFKFHENQRPPYYGTWRKKSKQIGPRNPFAQDTVSKFILYFTLLHCTQNKYNIFPKWQVFFDYEIDSDDEWEEEEPGIQYLYLYKV